ncbi:MAG: hypothetical protein Q9216_004129 [Gyalolechia sp. 2 TL-2023]
MAPKRKNKKPAANPARGFATISTASKAKTANEVSAEVLEPGSVPDDPNYLKEHVGSNVAVEKELHELSPEELEKRLEESDLNIFLEKHCEKIRRDASRQISKSQTEKRVLRAQADPLQTRSWLPSDIMDLVIQTIESEHFNDRYCPNASNHDESSEDDLYVKVWTLKRVLIDLGFSAKICQEALQHLLSAMRNPAVRDDLTGKDTIWGLECCLDWLALHCEAQQTPSYLPSRTAIQNVSASDKQPLSQAQTESSDSGLFSTGTVASSSSSPPSQIIQDGANAALDAGNDRSPSSSDADSDLDPDTMTERYMVLQTRLYELDPERDVIKSKALSSQAARPNTQRRGLQPQISKILRRLERLTSDILFDRYEAEQKWTEKRNGLVQAAAQRKRLQLNERAASDTASPERRDDQISAANQSGEAADTSREDDEAVALGDFFSGLPEFADTDICGTSNLNVSGAARKSTNLRDFGKWSGISPRRTFEETCKARDASARVTYQLINRSPFVKQHLVHIRWSSDQPRPLESPTEAILCTVDRRTVTVEMTGEATPDAGQSEAYVSTAAMFLIFSSIPKEEKASLRLPPIWKDLWVELFELKRNRDMVADREELQEIRALVDARPKNDNKASQQPQCILSGLSTLDVGTTLAKKEPGQEQFEHLQALWASKSATPTFQNMLRQRMTLPIWGFKDTILQTIHDNQITIVCGETGCGKSTQVPSFILERELSLDRACKIYCTEPRRISAISLARRVSEELGERKGDVGTFRSIVGYAIRMENKLVRDTRLIYATTGIVMRMLESSDDLKEITHLVLDEVHERSIESDFLLIVLRKLLARRPNLRVVLMSATVDAAKFSNYFDNAPVMTVPGRTFPVETRYLEDAIEETSFTLHDARKRSPAEGSDDDEDSNVEQDTKERHSALAGYSPKTRTTLADLSEYHVNYDLIVTLLETIAKKPKFVSFSKAILVFLPGLAEIRRLNGMLSGYGTFSHGWQIHALHSSIAMDEQERAFALPPPGQRKIVLSTNIAETGVTIPDVTCVIDTGKHKEMRFDERRQLSRLIEVFISRANAKQRRGRAGRVQEGLCFHLFTKGRHDAIMAQEQTPEMLRLSLQDLVLRVKLCKLGGVEKTLSKALDPPIAKNIRRAIDALIDVKALTVSEELTALGRQLARLPLDVFLGKLVLLGSIFGCIDSTLTIAAILSSKSPFSAPMSARSQADQARLAFKKGNSDPLTVYNAYCSWRRACNASGASEQQFCRKNCLSQQNLLSIEELKAQLAISLVDAGFLDLKKGEEIHLNKIRSWTSKRTFVDIPARFNQNETDLILSSILCWSFYPKLLKRDGKGWRNVANNQSVSLHPTSVNKGIANPTQWLSFYHIMQSSNKFYNAHETSAVEPFAFVLACGDAEFKMYSGVIVIDGNRIRLSVEDWKVMLAIKTLRQKLRQITGQLYRDPGYSLSSQQQKWLDIWQRIFACHDENEKSRLKKNAR